MSSPSNTTHTASRQPTCSIGGVDDERHGGARLQGRIPIGGGKECPGPTALRQPGAPSFPARLMSSTAASTASVRAASRASEELDVRTYDDTLAVGEYGSSISTDTSISSSTTKGRTPTRSPNVSHYTSSADEDSTWASNRKGCPKRGLHPAWVRSPIRDLSGHVLQAPENVDALIRRNVTRLPSRPAPLYATEMGRSSWPHPQRTPARECARLNSRLQDQCEMYLTIEGIRVAVRAVLPEIRSSAPLAERNRQVFHRRCRAAA